MLGALAKLGSVRRQMIPTLTAQELQYLQANQALLTPKLPLPAAITCHSIQIRCLGRLRL